MKVKNKIILFIINGFKTVSARIKSNKKVFFLLFLLFYLSTFWPDMVTYKQQEANKSTWVYSVEYGLRFVNTAAQVVIPIVLFDKVGMIQAVNVGLATAIFAQSFKRIFNNIKIDGVKIGERPSGSNYNMPSGHSAMAASAMVFVAIRYGAINLVYLLPITLLTMIVRVLLKAHTVTGVISGFVLGIAIGIIFTSKYTGNFNWKKLFSKTKNK